MGDRVVRAQEAEEGIATGVDARKVAAESPTASIAWAKLASLVEGAALASSRL